jgi:hypothetical protein
MFKPGSDSLIYASDVAEIYDSEELNVFVLYLKTGAVADPRVKDALEICGMFIFKNLDQEHYQLRRITE